MPFLQKKGYPEKSKWKTTYIFYLAVSFMGNYYF
jgi:hypothetical protein